MYSIITRVNLYNKHKQGLKNHHSTFYIADTISIMIEMYHKFPVPFLSYVVTDASNVTALPKNRAYWDIFETKSSVAPQKYCNAIKFSRRYFQAHPKNISLVILASREKYIKKPWKRSTLVHRRVILQDISWKCIYATQFGIILHGLCREKISQVFCNTLFGFTYLKLDVELMFAYLTYFICCYNLAHSSWYTYE